MKKTLLIFSKIALLLFFTVNCFAQAPQSFSYQAVVRDAQGNILPNQNVAFRFSIIENNTNGTIVYQETQQATTNTLGLVVLAIGNGTVQQGVFSTIQWGSAPHFLKVELDVAGGTNFADMGTTQLLSVPYALHAETAGNVQTYTAGNGISITGNVIENTAPNQPVTILGQGATSVTGTYPNFTISSTDNVNDADADPNNELQTLNINGNQLSISSGNTVNLPTGTTYTAGNGIDLTGNTITNTAPDQAVILNNGTGISITGSYPNYTITNSSPNQPVSINGLGATTVSGTYPNFIISSTDNNTTYTAGTGLNLIGMTFSHAVHTGDATGANSLTVTGIQGRAVSSTAPTNNQILKWNGSAWTPSTDDNTTYTAGTGISITSNTINSTQTLAQTLANGNNAGSYNIDMNTKSLTNANILGLGFSNSYYLDMHYGHIRDYWNSHGVDGQVLRVRGTSPDTYVEWATPSTLITAGTGLSYTGNTLNSVWTKSGNNIYNNNTGRIGIGITNPNGKVTIQGDTSNVLFEVRDKNGIPVFVVYQDSVQVFVNNSAAKTNKGTFAVNGKTQSKAGNKNYLRISPDSSRVYTENPTAGFGVRDLSGGSATNYLQLNPYNYFIGHNSGQHIILDIPNTTGIYNCTMGYEAGMSLVQGAENVFIGYNSGREQTSGWSNVAVGSGSARYTNTTYTTFVGTNSGTRAQGDDNVYIGYNAGKLSANNDNFNSVFIGSETGYNTFGTSNTIIGSGAGSSYTTNPSSRNDNIFLGQGAGLMTTTGGLTDGNICIGNGAGYSAGYTGSNQLFIENSGDVVTPLIHGNFSTNRIAFHRTATTYPLQVGTNNTNGNAAYLTAGGTWTNTSSKSLKDRFEELNKTDLLSKIEQLDVKAWYYKGTLERHIGPFAEDFYQAFGTGVLDEPTYLGKSLAASDVAGVSLAAVKELIIKNKQQSDLINQLIQRIEQLENKLNGTQPTPVPIQNTTR